MEKRSASFQSSVEAQEKKNKEQEDKLAALAAEFEKEKTAKAELAASLKILQANQDAAQKLARFNTRMAGLTNDYEMDDDDCAAVAPCAKDMDDESYAKWLSATFMPLARGKKKKPMVEKKADTDDSEAKVKAKTDEKKVIEMEDEQKKDNKKDDKENLDKDQKKASEAIVAAVIATATIDPKEAIIPNSVSSVQQSLKEQYAKATDLNTVFEKRKEKVSLAV